MKHAVWLFIHPGYFAQLLSPAFCSFPPLHAHSALPSASLKTIFFIQWVSFPILTFCIGLVAVTYHCGFIQSLLTAKNTRSRRWREGQQCLRCSSTAPADCLNKASNKGQQPAMFNSFANNKAGKKSQRKPSGAVRRWWDTEQPWAGVTRGKGDTVTSWGTLKYKWQTAEGSSQKTEVVPDGFLWNGT